MNTYTGIELSTTSRAVRGIIGAGSLMAIFFMPSAPGLTAGWLFGLAVINSYASMTAILGFDFIEATVRVIGEGREEQPVSAQRQPVEVDEYREAA